jgi:asparagine synthase (glutamine-hydrolysing)
VPLGVFLSGGVDSSLITAVAARCAKEPVRTFSVGFDEASHDETRHAAEVAAMVGTKHTVVQANTEMIDLLPQLARHFGEPFGDSSALPGWVLAQRARPYVTVALGGDGGDEAFAGYDWYGNAKRLDRAAELIAPRVLASATQLLEKLHLSNMAMPYISKGLRALRLLKLSPGERFACLRSFINDGEAEALYTGELAEVRRSGQRPTESLQEVYERASGSAMRRMRIVDVRTYLGDDLMPKVDVSSMAHGLELRAPLLDHRLVEFALSLPDSYLSDQRGGKRILRDLLSRYLPGQRFDRPKQGFSVPLSIWYRGNLRPRMESLATSERLNSLGMLRPALIRQMLDEDARGIRNHSQRLFSLLMLDEWLAAV